ncbi:MAG: hypothetical protein FJZ43_00330 [Candidatus Staskawiczbacteria bacterium]|nr:hypothetical protein [Candidatus Staskawiczbacteria bacterium]
MLTLCGVHPIFFINMNHNVKKLYQELIGMKDYSDYQKTNRLLESLFAFVLDKKGKNVLTNNEIVNLHKVISQSVYEFEKYWANTIIKSKNPRKAFESFSDMDRYRKLTKMEWMSLLICSSHKKHNILFIGGGPLPITAILIAQNHGQKVTVIDADAFACDISRRLVKKLGLSKKIIIIQSDALGFQNYRQFNVIFLASLVGIEKNMKENILLHMRKHLQSKTHILVRSTFGKRKILYPPLPRRAYDIFNPILEARILNGTINSVIIFEHSAKQGG